MDVECYIPKTFEEAKEIIKENACMKFCDERKSLYIKTDVLGWPGDWPTSARNNMSCHGNEAPDSSTLRPITFSSKSISGQRRGTAILREKYQAYCMALECSIIIASPGRYSHRPQATCYHNQERCSHIATRTPANPIKNTSVQGQNHIQAWTRFLYCILAIQIEPQ